MTVRLLVSLVHACAGKVVVDSKVKPAAFVGQDTCTCDAPCREMTREGLVMNPMSSKYIEHPSLFVNVTLTIDCPLGASNPKNVSPIPPSSLINRLAVALSPPLNVAVAVTLLGP